MNGSLSAPGTISGSLSDTGTLAGNISSPLALSGGLIIPKEIKRSNDYEKLENLPQIEGVTLIGNKSFVQLNMARITNSELEELLT